MINPAKDICPYQYPVLAEGGLEQRLFRTPGQMASGHPEGVGQCCVLVDQVAIRIQSVHQLIEPVTLGKAPACVVAVDAQLRAVGLEPQSATALPDREDAGF